MKIETVHPKIKYLLYSLNKLTEKQPKLSLKDIKTKGNFPVLKFH